MIGIYCITNKVNGKKYIGQSWNIEKRWNEHKSSKKNDHLRLSFKKYGIDNFDFSVIRQFSYSGLTQVFLDIFERKYILEMNTIDSKYGYNKNTGGGSSSKVSDEIKQKISKSNTGKKRSQEAIEKNRNARIEHYKQYGSWCTGVPKSEKTKLKISETLTGRAWPANRNNDYCKTKEHREKLSNAHKGLKWSAKRWEAYYKKYGIAESSIHI